MEDGMNYEEEPMHDDEMEVEAENEEETNNAVAGLQEASANGFTQGCKAIASLCIDQNSLQPIPGNQSLAVNSGAVELTLVGISTHGHVDAEACAAACSALCALLRKHDGAVNCALDCEEFPFSQLPGAMRQHAGDVAVQIAGCTAIFSAAWGNESVQDLLREYDAIEVIVAAMTAFPGDTALQAMACAALSNMCDSEETERHVIFTGALDKVTLNPCRNSIECRTHLNIFVLRWLQP